MIRVTLRIENYNESLFCIKSTQEIGIRAPFRPHERQDKIYNFFGFLHPINPGKY